MFLSTQDSIKKIMYPKHLNTAKVLLFKGSQNKYFHKNIIHHFSVRFSKNIHIMPQFHRTQLHLEECQQHLAHGCHWRAKTGLDGYGLGAMGVLGAGTHEEETHPGCLLMSVRTLGDLVHPTVVDTTSLLSSPRLYLIPTLCPAPDIHSPPLIALTYPQVNSGFPSLACSFPRCPHHT